MTGKNSITPMARDAEREALRAQFKQLTEELLPARAREERWPIRFDHCFKRICLDAAFQDCWYRHSGKPAEKHLDAAAFERANESAGRILREGRPALNELNRLSLKYRAR